MKYFAGIDNGGSATKCVIFDEFGKNISSASTRIPLSQPKPGFTERDARELWLANCQVIRQAISLAAIDPADIAGVSMCGFGGGLILADKNGNSTYPIIISTDSRANQLLQNLQETGIDDRIYQHTLQYLWAGQHAMLLHWFQKYHPEILEQTSMIFSIKDYIRYHLTGVFATEMTDASNTNLFHLKDRCFDPEIFHLLGIDHCYSKVAPCLLRPCEIAGYVTSQAALLTGLKAGTPVATGLYDVAACTLGSGILDEHTLITVMGTWSISGHISPRYEDCIGKNNGMCSFLDGMYFSEESSPTSSSNLDWVLHQMLHDLGLDAKDPSLYDKCNQLASSIESEDCDLIFLPYLYGSNSIADAKACFFNLSGYHTKAHILLSVYEGIIFSLLQHIRTLYGENHPHKVRFSGGSSRSEFWCQMLSDVLNTPVEVCENDELGALGSAMCASIAAGTNKDYADAVSHMCRISRTYYPNNAKYELYQKKYERFQKAITSLTYFYS